MKKLFFFLPWMGKYFVIVDEQVKYWKNNKQKREEEYVGKQI